MRGHINPYGAGEMRITLSFATVEQEGNAGHRQAKFSFSLVFSNLEKNPRSANGPDVTVMTKEACHGLIPFNRTQGSVNSSAEDAAFVHGVR
jgi:hypothetical protein